MATLAEFINKVVFKTDQNSIQQVNNSINQVKSFAKSALGAIGISLSVMGITNAIKGFIALSSEAEEMQNKFNAVFDGMTETVERWAKNYADSIGRNVNDIKTYLADMQNLLVGFMGTDMRKEASELAEAMTSMALDLSSFNNIDEAIAVNAMQKAVMGETEAAKTLGAVLNEQTRAEAMLTLGLEGKYEALSQANKMMVNYQAIVNQSPDAIGDCVRSLNSYRSTLISFQSKLTEIKTLLGQFFMPTAQKLIKFGSQGLVLLIDGIQRLNAFADSIGGVERILAVLATTIALVFTYLNFGKITSGLKDVTTWLGKIRLTSIAVVAGILLLALAIDDFFAFMRGDNSMIGEIFEKAGIDAEAARTSIVNAWNTVKTVVTTAARFVGNIVDSVFGGIRTFLTNNSAQIRDLLVSVWNAITSILIFAWNFLKVSATAAFGALASFWAQWGDEISAVFTNTMSAISTILSNALIVLTGLFNAFAALFSGDWGALWESILTIIDGVWNIIVTIVTTVLQNLWAIIGERVTAIKNTIVEGFTAAIDWIKSLPAQAVTWGSDIIDGIVSGIRGAIGRVGEAASEIASNIRSYLGFSEPEEGPLSNFHTYMPDMIDLMVQGITGGKERVRNAIREVAADMSLIANANVVSSGTSGVVNNSNVSRSIVQNVHFNNEFHGDTAIQKQTAGVMKKSANDVTSELARGLAYAR